MHRQSLRPDRVPTFPEDPIRPQQAHPRLGPFAAPRRSLALSTDDKDLVLAITRRALAVNSLVSSYVGLLPLDKHLHRRASKRVSPGVAVAFVQSRETDRERFGLVAYMTTACRPSSRRTCGHSICSVAATLCSCLPGRYITGPYI
jgi:hypothetical protein